MNQVSKAAEHSSSTSLSRGFLYGEAVSFPKSLGLMLPEAAAKYGDRPVLFFEGTWSSYREPDRDSSRFADGLTGIGVGPNKPVVLHVANSRDWIVAYYGTAKAGAIVVPIDAMLTPEEVIFIVRDCEATVLISGLEDPAALSQIRSATSLSVLVLSFEAAAVSDAVRQAGLQ
jgi:long-chain acyl-CoA synthetase